MKRVAPSVAPKTNAFPEALEVWLDDALVGDIAHESDVSVHELRSEQTHLEELFFNLTETGEHRNRNLAEEQR